MTKKDAKKKSIPFEEMIESLASNLMLCDAGDLVQVNDILEEVGKLIAKKSKKKDDKVDEALQAAESLLNSILLQDFADPYEGISKVSDIVSAIQNFLISGEEISINHQKEEKDPGGGEYILDIPSTADKELISKFFGNLGSVVEEIEEHLLTIENEGSDEEVLEALRRVVHTLKGEAGALELFDIERLCHESESYVEEHQEDMNLDVLFQVKDWLEAIVYFIRDQRPILKSPDDIIAEFNATSSPTREERDIPLSSGEEVDVSTAEDASFQEKAGAETSEGVEGLSGGDGDSALISDFILEAVEHLDEADVHLLEIEGDPKNSEALNTVFRAFHTIKGVSGFLGLKNISSLAHETENLFDMARKEKITLEGEAIDIAFKALDMMKKMVTNLAKNIAQGKGDEAPEELGIVVKILGEITSGKKRKLGTILVEEGFVSESDLSEALEEQKKGPDKKLGQILVSQRKVGTEKVREALKIQRQGTTAGIKVRETVKVDMERLDMLIDAIGELVIAEVMVTQDPEILKHSTPRLSKNLRLLSKITRELQDLSMTLRLVPVKKTFQKIARIQRDLSKKAGKDIHFTMAGEETEIDRSLVDQISDPLTHMIRNAVDHGVELPEDRKAVGKATQGLIHLCAYHRGGNIHIELTDDGKGLDREAILKKAIERGIITSDDNLTDKDVFNLVFEPGFSTAKKVTEVSGRGVGMDVVKRNIENLRGRIEIDSTKGQGTKFRLVLPLTLAIIEGMVVKVRDERYILPVISILESLVPQKESINHVVGKGLVLKLRDQLIPFFNLESVMSGDSSLVKDLDKGVAIVVETAGRQVAFYVDEILGQQRTVVKSLSAAGIKKINGLAGAAILPDGRVGLILDVSGIIQLATGKY